MSRRYRHGTSLAIQALTTTSLAKCSVLVLILYTLSLICGSVAAAPAVGAGGLSAAEVGWSLGSKFLVNGDFSQGPVGWTFPSTCFRLDLNTPAPNGAVS